MDGSEIENGSEAFEGISDASPNVQPESPYAAAPQSWQRDVAERHWNGLADDLKGYLHTRETQAHSKITELGRRVAELDGVSSRYDGVFQRYQQYIPEGVDREQAIEGLLTAQRLLSEPETRMAAIGQLLEMYGVNPADLLPAQFREQFRATQRDLQTAREKDVQRTLDDFTKDKAYYPEIREDVIKEILEIRKGAPGLDNLTVLKLAHDRALDRSGVGKRLESEREAERLAKAEEERKQLEAAERARNTAQVKAAKKAAGINVKSSPGHAANARTLDDDLRAIAKRHYG
jgi:hypothetical protein